MAPKSWFGNLGAKSFGAPILRNLELVHFFERHIKCTNSSKHKIGALLLLTSENVRCYNSACLVDNCNLTGVTL